jgi:endoglycosylceramidase
MRLLSVLPALAALVACADPAALSTSVPAPKLATLKLTTDGPLMKDALGRAVTLRGVNAGGQSKRPPYFPFAFAESGIAGQESAPKFEKAAEDYVAIVADRGFTVVRLLFMWEAVEPTRGTYDEVYLGRLAKLAEDFGARGIRVVLDNHQDVYARVFCGNGFPMWTLDGYSANGPASCNPWYGGYLGQLPDMSAAYDRFFANTDGIQDKFVAMWRHVAHRVAGIDNVVAFEILNEPFFGTMDEATWAAGPLRAFFEKTGAALREEAPGRLLFFDPSGTSPQVGGAISSPPTGTDWVFAPHYYEPLTFILGADDSMDWREMPTLVAPIAEFAQKWNVPVFLGEFGISNTYMHSPDYLSVSWDALDANQLSGTCWHLSTTPDFMEQEQLNLWRNGQETPGLDASVRPSPVSVAGKLVSFTYDSAGGSAVLSLEATAGGVTELVVPKRRYPKGPVVSVEGGRIHFEHDAAHERLRFSSAKSGSLKVTLAR